MGSFCAKHRKVDDKSLNRVGTAQSKNEAKSETENRHSVKSALKKATDTSNALIIENLEVAEEEKHVSSQADNTFSEHTADNLESSSPSTVNNKNKQYRLLQRQSDRRIYLEPVRLILHYGCVSYVDEYPEPEPLDGLPQLVHTDNSIAIVGPLPIARYLADCHDVQSDDELEAATSDMLMEVFVEIRDKMMALIIKNRHRLSAGEFLEDKSIKDRIDFFEKTLNENNTGWFVGKQYTTIMKVSWVDLAVSDLLAVTRDVYDTGLLDKHPRLVKHIDTIRSIPDITEYIETRGDIKLLFGN